MAFTFDEKQITGQLKTRHLVTGEYTNENLTSAIYFDDSVATSDVNSVMSGIADSLISDTVLEGSGVEYSEVRVTTSDYYRNYGG